MSTKSAFKLAVVASLLAAAPAAALVRLGGGGAVGFAFPSAGFDHDVKSAPAGGVRLYGNFFHWLAAEVGADFYTPFSSERASRVGETRLITYNVGFLYRVHMGVFMPFAAAGYTYYDERVRYEEGWEDVAAPGFYVGPGLEYYFSERFAARGMFAYDRAFDGGRTDGRDTQFVKLEFGVVYFPW